MFVPMYFTGSDGNRIAICVHDIVSIRETDKDTQIMVNTSQGTITYVSNVIFDELMAVIVDSLDDDELEGVL